jgi:hypothetical protein
LIVPAWEAWIEHVPVLTTVTLAPDTVQTGAVLEVKLTARPEDEVAVTVNGLAPSALFGRGRNVMVWVPCETVKLCVTGVAAV